MRLAALVILPLSLACAYSAPTRPYEHKPAGPDADPEFRACLDRPEVRAYLEALHREVTTAWELPAGIPPDQEVLVRFELTASGEARNPYPSFSTSGVLTKSVLEAFERSSPFGPLRGPASCLAGTYMSATFRNPEE